MTGNVTAVQPVLMARDVAVSLEFYARLGFVTVFRDDASAPRYAAVRRGPVELHLQWTDESQWAHSGDRPAYRFPTIDVDALFSEFVANKACDQVGRGPWDSGWGTRELHVRDPGGNVLQFYCPLPEANDEGAAP